MSSSERYERRLPTLLEELSAPRTPDYVDDILGQVGRTRQRPGWTFPERWLPMSAVSERLAAAPRAPVRAIVFVALLVLALVAAIAIIAGSRPAKVPAPFGPAANGLIPYIADGDVYVGNPLSGETRLLVSDPEDDAVPRFSPDGTRVAFIRDVRTAGALAEADVYVVNADGSDLHRITPHPVTWQDIRWTPQGDRVAVIHTEDTVNQLDFIDASGSGKVERIAVAAGLDSLQYRPPNGKEILFRGLVEDTSVGTTTKAKGAALLVMDADGTNVRTLLKSKFGPEMSLDLSGATYSADGSQIFYALAGTAPNADDGCCRLWVMNADGSNPHEFVPPTGRAWDGAALVSPDGTKVAYWHNANDGPAHGISVVRADGTGPVIDTGPKLTAAHYVWSPDSSKILMYPDDNSDLSGYAYLLDPDGGPWTKAPWRSDADLDWQRLAP